VKHLYYCSDLSLLSLLAALINHLLSLTIAIAMPKLFDLIAIVLVIVAAVEQKQNGGQYLTGLNALVVGLLWFKILGKIEVHCCPSVWRVTLSNLCLLVCPCQDS
jgi:hypothetical protein